MYKQLHNTERKKIKCSEIEKKKYPLKDREKKYVNINMNNIQQYIIINTIVLTKNTSLNNFTKGIVSYKKVYYKE